MGVEVTGILLEGRVRHVTVNRNTSALQVVVDTEERGQDENARDAVGSERNCAS